MFFLDGFNNINALLKSLNLQSEEYWVKRGSNRALKLFNMMSERVPAYKEFLKKNNISPGKIRTIKDFENIPPIDKNNYLRTYPLEALCWDGKFKSEKWIISTTSGSTGSPFYFPRQKDQAEQYALLAELYLRTNFQIHKKSTLFIVGFPMGAWIGGLFTFEALQMLSERGDYKLTIITPGINKIEIINAIKKLGKEFDQVIIGSYAPFLKDILDDGKRYGLIWKDYNLKFIFSAEGFTERFRDYVLKKGGQKDNIYTTTLNHYGTVDLGTMSYETPISIFVRRSAIQNNSLYNGIFRNKIKLPTLTQYIPEMFYFEDVEGNLLCSAFSGLPLVRYDLKDHGGITGFEKVQEIFHSAGVDLYKEASENNIRNTVWRLPFVYVYERSDFSVSFYAFNIYPETIRKALQKRGVEKEITGKFTMLVKNSRFQTQYLEINVELKAERKWTPELKQKVKDFAVIQLLKENSEYRKTYEEMPKQAEPSIVFWPYEHPLYFKPGIKQKWVNRKE